MSTLFWILVSMLFLSVSCVEGQISLESCKVSLHCDQGNGVFSSPTSSENSSPQSIGPPGKQGPKGERGTSVSGERGITGDKGERGEPGESCECEETTTKLQQTVDQLNKRLSSIENAYRSNSCADMMAQNLNTSGGVFTIYPFAGKLEGVNVFCDLETDGGGWLVFQKRMDGSENFNRGWDDYVNGFGSLDGEFWFGLENIHRITSTGNYELRVDMEGFDDEKRYALYSTFSVGPGIGYNMTIAKPPTGNAGDGMKASGTKFTTFDKDQDTTPTENCAETYLGGGWFGACHTGHPNGVYHGGCHSSFADGVNWRPFRGYNYSLKRMEMKIRKKAN